MSSIEFTCPICRRAGEPANQITICSPCHGDLIARGQVALTSTAEFAAMTPEKAAAVLGRDNAEAAVTSATPSERVAVCSWCGKNGAEAKKLLSNGDAHICDGCVSLCSDILTAELGEGWR